MRVKLVLKLDESFDEKILISDILIGNSIFIFSQETKIGFENNKYVFFMKNNGNINFLGINWQNVEIFSSLFLDGKYERYLSNKSSTDEYKKF